jgi:Septum formation
MSARPSRRTLAVVLLTAAASALSGCAAMETLAGGVEPERDSATGEIVEAAQADAFALRVGDCLNVGGTVTESEETQMINSVPTVPCGDEHDGEVYASHLMEDAEYPGDEATAATADELCYANFEGFVGMAYEDSALDFTMFYPTAESWELGGDREILCIVVDPEAGVTGSLEGVAY